MAPSHWEAEIGALRRLIAATDDPHVWDASTVAALDASTPDDQRKGKPVKIARINKASAERHGRLTGELPSH